MKNESDFSHVVDTRRVKNTMMFAENDSVHSERLLIDIFSLTMRLNRIVNVSSTAESHSHPQTAQNWDKSMAFSPLSCSASVVMMAPITGICLE